MSRFEGYVSLTQAIKDGKEIDYSTLDGRKIIMVNADGREYRGHQLELAHAGAKETYLASWRIIPPMAQIHFPPELYLSWHGKEGWGLWVEAALPVRPAKKAEALRIGMQYLVEHPVSGEPIHLLVVENSKAPGEAKGGPGDWRTIAKVDFKVLEAYGPMVFAEMGEGND